MAPLFPPSSWLCSLYLGDCGSRLANKRKRSSVGDRSSGPVPAANLALDVRSTQLPHLSGFPPCGRLKIAYTLNVVKIIVEQGIEVAVLNLTPKFEKLCSALKALNLISK